MQVFQTAGAAPSSGRIIFPSMGWTKKSSAELSIKVMAYRTRIIPMISSRRAAVQMGPTALISAAITHMKHYRRLAGIDIRASLLLILALLAVGCPAKQGKKVRSDSGSRTTQPAKLPPSAAVEDDSGDGGSYPGRIHIVEPKDTL